MIATGIVTYILLQYVTAPFGKHAPEMNTWKYGPLLDARLSWFLMESPNLFHVWRRFDCIDHMDSYRILLLILFGGHYFNRSIIYSYRMSNISKRMSFLVMISALFFCSIDGYLQVESLCRESEPLNTYQFFVGVLLFISGFFINLRADNTLRELKKQSNGYNIPVGGLFRFVSCPNFLGEIIEWIGFAIACNSKASFAFAIYTGCNLIPRAVAHHQWYLATFKDYPMNRQALFPFL